jgi:dTMP kinase
MNKGKLFVLEGLDGSSKSTQAKLLLDYFKQRGEKAFLITQPSQSLIGGMIRSRLRKEWNCSVACLQTLYCADGINSNEKEITPRLEKGINVICDRYSLSAFGYGMLGSDYDWLKKLYEIFLIPDITFYLDTSVEECIRRLNQEKDSFELYEDKEVLLKVQKNYYEAIVKIGEQLNVVKINGNDTIDNIHKKIITTITNLEDQSFDSDCI